MSNAHFSPQIFRKAGGYFFNYPVLNGICLYNKPDEQQKSDYAK